MLVEVKDFTGLELSKVITTPVEMHLLSIIMMEKQNTLAFVCIVIGVSTYRLC